VEVESFEGDRQLRADDGRLGPYTRGTTVNIDRWHESRQLAPGTINLRLGAVRRLAYEAADCGLLSSDLAAGIRRVKGVKKLGMRLGNWLTAEQGHALWQAPILND
jgi:hypothetical protein